MQCLLFLPESGLTSFMLDSGLTAHCATDVSTDLCLCVCMCSYTCISGNLAGGQAAVVSNVGSMNFFLVCIYF